MKEYGVLESRGYKGTISYCGCWSGSWYGKIVDISDLVTYEADSYEELVEEFKDAVLEYIDDLHWRSSPHMRMYTSDILQGE
ncbi:putative antitoxin [Pseudaeromonas phage vB_PpeM_ KLEP7]|nr:putative antitoxin [Pseudaeromonas phage vB_PpeM_ KLEP7]